MVDTNDNLKMTHDGPGPQYKNHGVKGFSFAEGEDGKPYSYDKDVEAKLEEVRLSIIANKIPGTQKVNDELALSKLSEIKASIIANKPPATQNVKDTDVKTELEAIKQSVADNKATNDLILEKLEGTLDTQVMGSNVEDGIAVKEVRVPLVEVINEYDVVIPPGTIFYLVGELLDGSLSLARSDLRSYTHFSVGIQKATGVSSEDVNIEVRNKFANTGGSITEVFNTKSEGVTAFIEKTPISLHNMSVRISHDSNEDMILRDAAVSFWRG